MAIRYMCRHCETEVGSIPFESAKETLNLLKKMDTVDDEQFLKYDKDGSVMVQCICEQCEQSLRSYPEYYMLNKWLQ